MAKEAICAVFPSRSLPRHRALCLATGFLRQPLSFRWTTARGRRVGRWQGYRCRQDTWDRARACLTRLPDQLAVIVEQAFDALGQRSELRLEHVPHDVEVDLEVDARNEIAHSRHLAPLDLRC